MKGPLLSAALASAAAASLASRSAGCCASLSDQLPSILYSSGSDVYTTLIEARWSKTSILEPGCVITPTSAAEVSTIVKLLADQNCHFSVKSGGHNANPEANCINDGVSIDLRYLTAHSASEDKSYVTLGTGLSWGDAYRAFEDQKISFTGGICEDVGVGGVAVGGGQSLFQVALGWVVDNILRYEVVLASGEVVNATETEHPRLYKALKGGSTNFGIVTAIDLVAFELDKIWGGVLLLLLNGGRQAPRDEMIDTLSSVTVDFIENNDKDPDSGLQVVVNYLRDGRQIVDLALTNNANIANPPALNSALNMPNQLLNTTRHTSIVDLARETSEAVPRGFRYVTSSVTISNDLETLREIWAASDAIHDSLTGRDQADWLISFVPQPSMMQSHASKRGGNVLGLHEVEGNQIVIWLLSRWDDPKYDDIMTAARDQFVDEAIKIAKRRGTYSPFLYVNYAGQEQNPLCGYGSENVAFIKAVAEEYDPTGVFQKLMPGGFKISNAQCTE